MSQPELTVTVDSKTKTELARNCKKYLSMTQDDESVRPMSYLTPCTGGEFDEIGWVLVPPHNGSSKEVTDRIYTRDASWEENKLGAERDNEQLYRTKNGVQERRFNGNWIKSLGLTEGKSSIPAHVHIFGHKNGVVIESLGHIVTYMNTNEYVVAVQTEFGPVPRVIKVAVAEK